MIKELTDIEIAEAISERNRLKAERADFIAWLKEYYASINDNEPYYRKREHRGVAIKQGLTEVFNRLGEEP